MILPNQSKVVIFFEKNYARTRRVLFRLKSKITGNTRPSSYPYVSGDSFRALADHIHDEVGTFNPIDVKLGDIVFVSNAKAATYLREINPLIKNKYILIVHNGDTSLDEESTKLLSDDKIIRCYLQLAKYDHEKIVPIPICLENLHYQVNGVTSVFDKLRKQIEKNPPVRKNRVFFFFSLNTNPAERGPAKEYFLQHKAMDTTEGMLSPIKHLKTLMTYKFVASPPGNGIESSRTWEALYVKNIPIVKDSVAIRYFESIGLPIWVVRDWHELDNYGEKELGEKYDELMKKANWAPLHMDYWIEKIKKDQKESR